MKTLPLALALATASTLASAHPTISPTVGETQTRVRAATSEHTLSNDSAKIVTALWAGLLLLNYAFWRQYPARKTETREE